MILRKDWRNIDFTFALVYPNIEQVGSSSYSIRLLHNLINSHNNIACEQAFLPEHISYPAREDYTEMVRSIENKVLLKDFDIIGFTLQFENDFKNILWLLENAHLPISCRERNIKEKEKGKYYPLIIAGGPVATSNPLPFSKFIDLFFIGDSEPNLEIFLTKFKHFIEIGDNKENLYQKLKGVEGIYIPSTDGKINRAIQHDLNSTQIPIFQGFNLNLREKTGFGGNFMVEVNRGCPYSCRFCISSYHNKPFRNRSYEKIIETIRLGIESSNFDKITLIGSCVSAHPKFNEICNFILNQGKKFTIPSIRIEHVNTTIINLLEKARIKTITIAPESGSERLRYALNKKISNDQIYSVVQKIKDSEIKNIKFYFLIGLPGETEEDIEDLINMMIDFDKMGFEKDALRLNINPFVPKPRTPFEREVFYYLNENLGILKERLQKIASRLKNLKSIKLKFKNIREIMNEAKLQAFISLGDRDTSSFLEKYYEEGANFGALRRVEKEYDFRIQQYFDRIKQGYLPKS